MQHVQYSQICWWTVFNTSSCVSCNYPTSYITLCCYISALQLCESCPVFILRLSFYSNSNCHTYAVSACLTHKHTHTLWLTKLSKGLGVCVCVCVGHTWQPQKCDLSMVVQLSFTTWGSWGWSSEMGERERQITWANFSLWSLNSFKVCF